MPNGAFSFMLFLSNGTVFEILCLFFFPSGLEKQGPSMVFKRIFLFDKGPSPDDFVKATVAYMLGRNSLYVESEYNADFEKLFDKCIGHTVCKVQIGLNLLCYIPNVIIRIFSFCILKVLCTLSKMLRFNTEHERFEFKLWLSREKPSLKYKERAYEILIKCCGPSHNTPKEKAEVYAKDAKEKIIKDIFEKDQTLINLPLLLDGSTPSGLLYLLIILDEKLEASRRHELEASDRHELETYVSARYTHV